MTSHVLLEGILHVKDPRGSEDRKFWKVWRRQWVSFSVIYPSGRREPHLLLQLSHCSSETSERQIRVQREGLRIFRCRSKSRPYRAWAIMSGNKLVLYFAAASELQAQYWMKELRDGLWPPCFSFQMLTACSHEVSLIDDENTFLSGLLGVYGRFVLTSEDVISLMHPYWGCTLLQIPLSSVHDVLFVREAEVQPAGVFSIVLKRDEELKAKKIQFFCNTAMDAIQWILNKLHANNSEINDEELKYKLSIEEPLILVSEATDCLSSTTENFDFQKTDSTYLNSFFSEVKITDSPINTVHANSYYENLQCLKPNSTFNSGDCISIPTGIRSSVQGKQNNFIDSKNHVSWKLAKTNDSLTRIGTENVEDSQYLGNELSKSKLNTDNLYTNCTTLAQSTITKSQNYSNYNVDDMIISKDSSTEYQKLNFKDTGLEQRSAAAYDTLKFGPYLTVNKKKSAPEISHERILEEEFLTNELLKKESIINNHISELKDPKIDDIVLPSKSYHRKADCSAVTSTNNLISEYYSAGLKTESEIPFYGNVNLFSGDTLSTGHALYVANSHAFGDVEKEISSQNAPATKTNVQIPTNSLSSDVWSKKETNRLLPNISSDILNTSFKNSTMHKNKTGSDCSSPDGDTGTLPWEIDEFINLEIGDRIYEDISDRRGTVYEEIDSSESDNEDTFQQPPSLPERPKDLEIPNSLRLLKLSKSIEQILETSDRPSSPTKRYPRPAFIKKIKDVSRIMQISPTRESSREPFSRETKLPIQVNKSILVLKSPINSPQTKTNNEQFKWDKITRPKNAS